MSFDIVVQFAAVWLHELCTLYSSAPCVVNIFAYFREKIIEIVQVELSEAWKKMIHEKN
jgi:hypothetical protein